MWFPLINYTHYSLTKAFSKPEELVDKCVKEGYTSCGIADYRSLSGAVKFYKACVAKNIKPIIGCSFDGFSLFAKNENGWKELIKLVSNGSDGKVSSDNILRVHHGITAIRPSYYTNREDAVLHRILLCSGMKTTFHKVEADIRNGIHFDNKDFFIRNDYHVYGKEESDILCDLDKEGLELLRSIDAECSQYNILKPPKLPKIKTPNGESEEEYLRQLCRDGWKRRLIDGKKLTSTNKSVYLERFEHEFSVIRNAELFGYFLIVYDIIRFVKESGWMAGSGRGSVAGSLIAYLLGITDVDPLEFDLIFERFYSDGRNVPKHVSFKECSYGDWKNAN